MKGLFLKVSIPVFLLISFRIYPDTNIYVMNNTRYPFFVTNIDVQGKTPFRKGEHWRQSAREAAPNTVTKILSFNRNVGVKNGERYTLDTYLKGPFEAQDALVLKQKLQGRIVGSHMWQGLKCGTSFIGWYDNGADRSWKRPACSFFAYPIGRVLSVRSLALGIKPEKLPFVVRFKAIEAGSYNDLYYDIIEKPNTYTTYSVLPTKGEPNKINILTYNTFLLQPFIGEIGAAPKRIERARLIPDEIKSYDIVVFNEIFDDDARFELMKGLKRVGFKYATCILGSGFVMQAKKYDVRSFLNTGIKQPEIINFSDSRFDKNRIYTQGCEGDPSPTAIAFGKFAVDGGVFIASKYPIKKAVEMIYAAGTVEDQHAKKGVIYVIINKEGKRYHLFATHTQAWPEKEMVEERLKQLKALKHFITTQKIPTNEPVLIAGDLNVDKSPITIDGKKYNELNVMLSVLNAVLPQIKGTLAYTHDPYKNALNIGRGEPAEYLDYILYGRAYQKPIKSFNEVRSLCSKKSWGSIKVHQTGTVILGKVADFFNKLRGRDLTYDLPAYDLSDHYAVYGHFEFPN